MRSHSRAVKEDPETEARRKVDEARAEADRTSATQALLSSRTRRVLRIFGKASGVGSGASGVQFSGRGASAGRFGTAGFSRAAQQALAQDFFQQGSNSSFGSIAY